MSAPPTAAAHDLRLVTWAGAAASAAFVLLALVTTQVDEVALVLPFTSDPYDAVTWFALLGIAVIGAAWLVRAIGYRNRPYDAAVARRIAIGAAIAIGIVAIAIASDLAAIAIDGVPRRSPGFAIAAFLLVLAAFDTTLGLVATWRARSSLLHPPLADAPEPDLIDAVAAIVDAVGARDLAARSMGWVERSPMSPRRHRVAAGLWGAIVAGVGAVVWHAVREGAWATPTAAAIFGGLMAAGVIGPYLFCLEPLRLIRSARPD